MNMHKYLNGKTPQLSYRNNSHNALGGRWHMTVSTSEERTVDLEIRHHWGYDNMEDYRAGAYKVYLLMEGERVEAMTCKQFDERFALITQHEGPGKAAEWAAGDGYIVDETTVAIAQELMDHWETMVFRLELFSPTVCM